MLPKRALRKRVPDSLRWAGSETSISARCRQDFFPVCRDTLSSENGQRPTQRPSPMSLPPDLALINPTQPHPEWTWSPNALAHPDLLLRRPPWACAQAADSPATRYCRMDKAQILEEETVRVLSHNLTSSLEAVNP